MPSFPGNVIPASSSAFCLVLGVLTRAFVFVVFVKINYQPSTQAYNWSMTVKLQSSKFPYFNFLNILNFEFESNAFIILVDEQTYRCLRKHCKLSCFYMPEILLIT